MGINRHRSVRRPSRHFSWNDVSRSVRELPRRWIKSTRSGKEYLTIPLPTRRQFIHGLVIVVGLIFIFIFIAQLYRYFGPQNYRVSSADKILPSPSDILAKDLKYDSKARAFTFSHGSANTIESKQSGGALVAASLPVDATKGITVTDPNYKVDLTMTPRLAVSEGKQQQNRVVYPIRERSGWLVYTALGTGIREDIVLAEKQADTYEINYDLKLPSGTEARKESNGSIGVYGNQVFMNNVTAASDTDQTLLEKARASAAKNLLLFTIPKPIVIESGKQTSSVNASFELTGTKLVVKATGLDKAAYPLSIDPSIYIVTAQQFMNGNNETNIDFDVADKLIRKAPTTGARFNSWNATTQLPQSNWAGGTAIAGGYVYSAGGISQNGQVYTTQGAGTFTVPSGVTSLTVKLWGGGGGGGAGGSTAAGGAGGGGGETTGTIAVTPGETLDIYVGGGGAAGARNTSGGGGGGGAFTSIYRGGTLLALAAGGGGGGGGRSTSTHIGGAGGAGGGVTGVNGSASLTNGGGGGGTSGSGGAAGSGSVNGLIGLSLNGGDGAKGATSGTGSGAVGGLTGGGDGGAVTTTTRAAGGGGGSGWFGGGGGSGAGTSAGGAGGGGGSSFGTGLTLTAGSGATPGNSGDSDRAGAGQGGTAGARAATGTNGSNGIAVIGYGSGGTTASAALSWMQLSTTDGTLQSPNPGDGVCSGWCTDASYNLPTPLTDFSMVAYNGFLYVIGGKNSVGTAQNSIYVAKIGANGEPQLWNPTWDPTADPTKSTWSYWYTSTTTLSSARSGIAAVAYNNRLYVSGGRTAGAPVNTMEIADILPTGQIGSWVSSTSLPYNVYNHSMAVYNDRLYILGGDSTVAGAPLNSVYYNKINSTGTLNTWLQTTSFTTGRMSGGGNFTTIWGAYLYISGGCSAVNASGYCTTVQSDTEVASINADGSIDTWNNVGGVSDQRFGQSLLAWRSNIYQIGGCTAQNTSSGACTTPTNAVNYGVVNQDGDASTVGSSVANGTAPCSGSSPSGCNMPGTTTIGNLLTVSFVSNGYLYIIGGCSDYNCATTRSNTAYVAISSTGDMSKPASCPSPRSIVGGMWCVDTTNVLPNGVAAGSPVIFNGRVYIVGGLGGAGNTGTLLRADINQNDGSLGTWASQTLSSLGVNSVSYDYAFARANPTDAANNPGNLYILGGCSTSSAMGCTAYSANVYKCNIQTAGAIASCSTSGQQQINNTGDSSTGLGIMSGTIYANYLYLIGGVTPNLVDLKTVHYAKIDNNNNIVSTINGTSSGGWVESPYQMAVGRRRSAAFGYNGYLYAVGGYEVASGVLADIEFIKINVSDGSLSNGWIVSSVQINQRWGLSVPISNSYAYVIGGCTNGASPTCASTGPTDIIQTFQVYNNDSGAPAGYSTSANTYTTDPYRVGASSTVLNGKLYVAGGCTSGAIDCDAASTNVSYSTIDSSGNLGAWTNTTGALPARTWGKLVNAGGSLYYIGGQSSTSTDERTEVYYATPSGTGDVSSWTAATNGLPGARSKFGAAVWNNRIYAIGGLDGGSATTATVYVSPQLNNGGNITSAWTPSTTFYIARSGAAVTAYANNLYIMGGYDGANYLSDVQYAQINTSSGLVNGSWLYSSSLPNAVSQADSFAANGYVYLFGGRSDDTVCSRDTLVAPISANTTIASGNNPTGVGAWYVTNQRFTGARYGDAAAYYDGKAYVMGGADCSSSATTTALNSPGVTTYTVPAGVTYLKVKTWSGGGGGGGGGGTGANGGAGGGSAYATATISVTPGEVLSVSVGYGGGGGGRNTSGFGGGGGGDSGIRRTDAGNTPLIIAGAGGAGGGARNASGSNGGAGGAGGTATIGIAGGSGAGTSPFAGGGGAGTASTGGAAGIATGEGNSCAAQAGSYLDGGQGADGRTSGGCTLGTAANGGGGFVTAAGGGSGGSVISTTRAGGGGGGSGYYGGGGGASSGATAGAGGGGGGSSYVTGINTAIQAGSGVTPGNSADTDRNGAGTGGTGGVGTGTGVSGSNGIVIITPVMVYATPTVQQTALLSQPQVAKYSMMIDTDSDVFPNYWLLNGVDNSVGARWQLKYRSMANQNIPSAQRCATMSTWGQDTSFGDVTLGTPGTYTVKDGSGTNISCGRYFFFNVTVDSSQAFGYPDDVSRGPTITDLTFQFTADPSKRLMHGRTFTGGLQMPDDTPLYNY